MYYFTGSKMVNGFIECIALSLMGFCFDELARDANTGKR